MYFFFEMQNKAYEEFKESIALAEIFVEMKANQTQKEAKQAQKEAKQTQKEANRKKRHCKKNRGKAANKIDAGVCASFLVYFFSFLLGWY